MLHTFFQCILLILAILAMVMLSQKLRVAYPIVLVLGGLLLSLIPGIPTIDLDPEMIFVIFLPPLLYEAAWYTSWKDFWRWRRIIGSFAFLIVIVTALVVALVASHFLPGFTLALGFLLGGIVSPPDAVSATSVLKHVKAPRRFSSILEGESLLNDASSLIVFRFALIAVDTGHFALGQATTSFFLVIIMGILIGLGIAMVYYAIHKWLPTDTHIDIILTLTAPYVMYICAEHFHFSGVLAVVSGGLFLSARSHLFLSHRSRLQGITVWSTLGFVLNGLVFMFIGLELPVIVDQLGDGISLWDAIGYGVLITGVLIVTRLGSAFFAMIFTVFISRFITTADSRPGWKGPLLIGWTGMRGVVSLAAALSLPLHLNNGEPFPQRNLIIFVTFIVILLTLVVQGLTLPALIRLVNFEDPDHYLPKDEQEANLRRILAEKSIRHIDERHTEKLTGNESLQQFRSRLQKEQALPYAEGDTEQADYREVYLEVIGLQRDLLHELNKNEANDEETIRHYLGLLDIEEEKIRLRYHV